MAAFTMAALGCIVDVAAAASVCGAADAPCLLRRRASMAFAALALDTSVLRALGCLRHVVGVVSRSSGRACSDSIATMTRVRALSLAPGYVSANDCTACNSVILRV
jgi:hypothetical protein